MVNTQPSQSNPVDLTSHEESLLHLTNHSVGEGTTRYHRGGLVDQQININIILHCRKHNCRLRIANRQSITPHKLWLVVQRWLQRHAFNKQCIRWFCFEIITSQIWVVSAEHRLHQAGSQRLIFLQENSASQELHTRGAINKLHNEYNVWCCLQ